jgi:cellulose synthase/poly-beta-1,6-N-acetylglucosamine synthase-like glycosyltransferase
MQCFDYEVSLACFVGPFSTFGMLPVIPGPCGFYRFDAICNKEIRNILKNELSKVDVESKGVSVKPQVSYIQLCGKEYIDAIDFYIKTVSVNPDECGMLMGCLLLAEDRVLSYAATLVTNKTYHTKYEPKACFYFEAETDPTQLLQQRRRWINGTVAGYVWLLSRISILFNSKMRFYEKMFLTALLFTQLMMFVIIGFGIPIMTIGIRYNAMKLLDVKQMYIEGFIGLYVLLYVLFVLVHSSPKRKVKLNVLLFDIITLVNMFIVGLLATCIGMYIWNREFTINLVLILFNIAMPFILAFLHDWKSLVLMFTSVIPFMLLLPTFTIYFCVYGFSRLWELTWGNRPSNKLLTLESTLNEAERDQIKRRQQNHAQSVAWTLVVINVILCFMFYSFQFNNIFIIALQAFLFIWAFIQMIMSLFYFVAYDAKQTLMYIFRFLTCRLNRKQAELNDKFGKNNEDCKKIIRSIDARMRGYNP